MQSSARNVVQFKAKLPTDVKDWLQRLADRNCSTITAELVRAVRIAKDQDEATLRS